MDSVFYANLLEKIKLAKDGIWISELARQLGVRESKVRYYLFGWMQKGKPTGGFLSIAGEIQNLKNEGSNHMVIYRKFFKPSKTYQQIQKEPQKEKMGMMTNEESEKILKDANMK